MSESCNNTSVGIIVRRDNQLLLIERRNPPYGWAPPAGHVDDRETYPDAARRELLEEVGLRALSLRLVLTERYNNQCRRRGGDHHHWQVFEADRWSGEPVRSEDETRALRWVTSSELDNLRALTNAHLAADASTAEWQQRPGLEPVWLDMLKHITAPSPQLRHC